MAYLYEFCDGDNEIDGIPKTSLVDLGEEWDKVLEGLDHDTFNDDRAEERHKSFSMDEYEFEGFDISDPVDYEEKAMTNACKDAVLSLLTETQRRRLLMRIKGLSEREIAREEGTNHKSVHQSICESKTKIKKYFLEDTPQKASPKAIY